YKDSEELFSNLRHAFKKKDVSFNASYALPADPLIMDKEHVQMTAYEIWKVSGYCFCKENKVFVNGHKTQYWCCQDSSQKQKAHPSHKEGAKHHDTLGMHHYYCHSCLRVSCREVDDPSSRQITIYLQHHEGHTPHYDGSYCRCPFICENLEWTTPNMMIPKIQVLFPAVTAAQIHSTWTTMSESLWKRDDLQLPSVEILLCEYSSEVDVFDLPKVDGTEQVAWGIRKVSDQL
ncbi:hypothetical protein L208DRAFT_1234445, partial [Tricholoma matsutake]